MRRRRGRRPEAPLPKRPYRDSALLNVALAAIVVVFAWLTGGDVVKAVAVGAAFFVVATAWSWWRFRQRLSEGDTGVGPHP
jgi:membrane protein implicated in regulation of membrane protease activity